MPEIPKIGDIVTRFKAPFYTAHDEVRSSTADVLNTDSQKQVWIKLSRKYGLDPNLVIFHENKIEIPGVGIFDKTDTPLEDGKWHESLAGFTVAEIDEFIRFLYEQISDFNIPTFMREVMNMKGGIYLSSTSGKGFDSEKVWAMTYNGERIVDKELVYKETGSRANNKFPRSLRKMM